MKNTAFFYLLLFAVMFNFSACGDKEEDVVEPSRLELLTATTWKTNKVLAAGLDVTDNPLFAPYVPDSYEFNTDKTFTITYPSGNVSGPWEFASNETVIVTNAGTPDEQKFTITELKANSLKVTATDPTLNVAYQIELVPVP